MKRSIGYCDLNVIVMPPNDPTYWSMWGDWNSRSHEQRNPHNSDKKPKKHSIG